MLNKGKICCVLQDCAVDNPEYQLLAPSTNSFDELSWSISAKLFYVGAAVLLPVLVCLLMSSATLRVAQTCAQRSPLCVCHVFIHSDQPPPGCFLSTILCSFVMLHSGRTPLTSTFLNLSNKVAMECRRDLGDLSCFFSQDNKSVDVILAVSIRKQFYRANAQLGSRKFQLDSYFTYGTSRNVSSLLKERQRGSLRCRRAIAGAVLVHPERHGGGTWIIPPKFFIKPFIPMTC